MAPRKNAALKKAKKDKTYGFSPAELRTLCAMKNPHGVQRFLDSLAYHLADTAWSPRQVLAGRTAHCLEGSIFAAAALRVLGYPALLLDLEAEHDTDHVLCLYKHRGHWGTIAKSNFTSCRGRQPVYRTLRELAMSYFDTYFNLRGERTLRTFSRPVNLKRFDHLDWMITNKDVWFVAEYLLTISHTRILTPRMEKELVRVDKRTFAAECLGRAVKSP